MSGRPAGLGGARRPSMKNKALLSAALTGAVLCAFPLPGRADPVNADKIKLFYEAFGQDKPELLDNILSPDWEDVPPNEGQAAGRDAFKPFLGGFHKIFPDLKVVNEDIIDAGDKVVVRSTITGTQAGTFAGFASKGKPFSVMAIDIHQFKNGKVIKTWHVENWLAGLFQMGAFSK